jgi:hypothetical protein
VSIAQRGRHLLHLEQRMKQTLRREMTNIVFLVLIVAAAVVIYLLSRAEIEALAPDATPTPVVGNSSMQSADDAEETAATKSPEDEKNQPTTRGVPESVFETHILSSDLYSADQSGRNKHTYTLTWTGETKTEAKLTYELREGCISSLELTFQLPEVFKGKPKNDVEKFVSEASGNLASANAEAIPALLSDLLPASDALGGLQQTSVRFWTDEALLLKKPGDKFEDTLDGYHFVAYRRQGESMQELICILFLT